MTVSLIAPSAQAYVGISSDDKPTSGVRPGATFIERNTGRTYTYDGTTWGITYALPEDVVDINLLVAQSVTGEAVLDEGEADWTDPQTFITIAPVANSPLREVVLTIDWDKATTGFGTIYTAETLTLVVNRVQTGHVGVASTTVLNAVAGSALVGVASRIDLGSVAEDETITVTAELDAEASGTAVAEAPFTIQYLAVTVPTVTAAEAGA